MGIIHKLLGISNNTDGFLHIPIQKELVELHGWAGNETTGDAILEISDEQIIITKVK